MSRIPLPRRGEEGFTLIELMIVVLIVGLLAAIAIPNFARMRDHAREAKVQHNCHTVQLVAEDFCVQNEGLYAASLAATLSDGRDLIDMLPAGLHLENPWSGARTEPRDGAPVLPGQVGYTPLFSGAVQDGYVVDGFGRDGICLSVSNGG